MKITTFYKNCAGTNGVQLDISFAGCEHKCEGCYIPELWDPSMFPDWSDEYVFREIGRLEKNVDGFVLLGGDPLFDPNKRDTIRLIEHLRGYGKPITMITGYTIEEIMKDPEKVRAYRTSDKIITGRYDKNKRVLEVVGSSNQITSKHERDRK